MMSRPLPSSISSLGMTPYSPSTWKSVTGTIRVRARLKAWFLCEAEIGHCLEAPSGAGEFPLDGSSKDRPRSRSPRRHKPSGGTLRVADPARVDRGRSGGGPGRHRTRFEERFSADRMAREYESAYRGLISAAAGNSAAAFAAPNAERRRETRPADELPASNRFFAAPLKIAPEHPHKIPTPS